MELFDFNSKVIIGSDIHTTLNGCLLILKEVYYYDGPITMQYLPVGGIQSVFDNKIIVNTLNGFMFCDIVIYDRGVGYYEDIFIFKRKNSYFFNTVKSIG